MTELRPHVSTALLTLIGISAMLFWFHDQFWWPVDEGVYAYVAQRALAGDVINRDVIDLHAGYGNLINIWAFRLFGEDLLSLRYPLVAITLVQCLIAYVLLASRGALIAMTGAVAVASFSFVQFANPSANWHALGLFFLMCLCLEATTKGAMPRLFLAGIILGLCFFTRQLSGVILALGLIAVLLCEAAENDEGGRGPGIVVGGIAFTGLLLYLVSKQHAFGLIWAGLAPLLLLLTVSLRARMTWGRAALTVALVTGGFVVAGLPLAAAAWQQGSLAYWANDIFITPMQIHGQDFIKYSSFGNILALGVQLVSGGGNTVTVLSGAAWILLIGSVPLLGALTLWRCARGGTPPPATAVLATFWAVSALHFQIPIYLFFVLPAVLFALLVLRPVPAMSLAMLALSAYALFFQAGQPVERGIAGTVAGERFPPNQPVDLPRVSLRLQPEDAAIYRDTIRAIEEAAAPGEPLMTLPMDPELNFMTGRKSPVRFYATPLGLTSQEDVQATLEALDAAAPLFVVNRREDKYLTPLSAVLLEQVRDRSGPPVSVGPFDLYRYLGSDQPLAFLGGR